MRSGTSMPVHHVECPCGTRLALKSYWREPRCGPCRRKMHKKAVSKRGAVTREQARRYRILIAVSPYDSFEELLRAVRLRQPHTRAYGRDASNERRCST